MTGPSPASGPAGPAPRRLAWIFAIWTVILVLGFGLVAGLGSPLPTAADELAAAKAPATPVTESVARSSAATIVRLEYPDLAAGEPVVERRTDFGIDRFVIVYSNPDRASGLRISITVAAGLVEIASFN